MRLAHITTYYPNYLEQFYAKHQQIKHKDYTAQYAALMSDFYGWADSWALALGKIGYEVMGIVGNALPAQKAWARERSILYDKKKWLTDIVMHQIKNFAPEVIFVNDYVTYRREFLENLKIICPSVRIIIGWCSTPYSDDSVFKAYDLILSCHPGMAELFRKNGFRCECMPNAFDPRILDKIDRASAGTCDFSFMGSIIKISGFHNERERILKRLIEETGLEIWSDTGGSHRIESMPVAGAILSAIPQIKNYLRIKSRPDFYGRVDHAVVERSKPALFGMDMYQKLYESKITLNAHIDIAGNFAANMRLYEATGVGVCMLTDWKSNLHELFDTNKEVATYKSAEEAVEKARYLLGHDDERKDIGLAGQRRTLKDHTFDVRARQLDELIRKAV